MTIYDLKKGLVIDRISIPLTIALGNFDGVHLGHAELIKASLDQGTSSAVWTFNDNPASASIITSNEEKLGLFAGYGLDYAVFEDFKAVRDFSPEQFVFDILIKKLNCKTAVCGFNFTFGKNKEGTPELLKKLLNSANADCIIIPPVSVKGEIVSSSLIRSLIEKGECERAAELLGRPFFITYPVCHGNKLGRTLGFPTINQPLTNKMVKIQNGVYVCRCMGHMAVTSVGVRPTVSDSNIVICETHIIDYSNDLYGENVKVEFYKKLRDEVKFDSLESLKAQIEKDIKAARDYFSALS